MPILKKTTFKQDLERVSVLIKDTDPFSKYFKISKLPDTFTGGKNAFLIQGSPQLVADTIVKIEIKDALGNPIYNEPAAGIPEYYEGTSKVISVHVYPDTAFGPATITILGELSHFVDGDLSVPIPSDWRDKYNVRWQGTVNVHPYAQNTTPIRFYRRPKIEITEEILPIYNRTVETKTETGNINGTSIIPIQDSDYRTFKGSLAYELSTTSSFFSQSMEGFQIDIQGLAKEYKPTITDVTSETKAFVNIPYFITSSGNPLYQQIKNFSNKPFSLTYENQVTLFNSNVSSSFARIKITDLETFTGDAARIKVYASSQNDLGDFQLLEDTILESTELLKVDEFSGALNVRTGIFSQQILDTFWKTEPINTSVTAEIDNNLLIKSVKLTPTTDINSFTSATPLFRFYNSGSINFTKFSEYQLDFTPLLSSSLGYAWIEVYGSGSAFISSDRTNDYGKLLTKLETNKPFLKYDKQQINFQPDQTGTGNILFVVKGGKWQIGNVSLAVAQESSFSPNEITLTVNVPTKINNETFDFKFELYDINNNYVPIDLTSTATFTGGNDVNIRRDLEVNTSANYFNFSTDGNYPAFITIDYFKTGLTGSVTFKSGAVDNLGNEITLSDLNPGADYPGGLEVVDADTVKITLEKFTGSLNTNTKVVGSITYTASCEDVNRYFTVFRVDQGAPAYLFYATADKNTFGFNPDDNSNSIILNDYIDIRLVKQNLPDPFGDGFQIISGSTGPKPAPPLIYTGSTGNADIYRLFISTSRDITPDNISGYTYEVSQSTYNFQYETQDKGIFTSSIVIDTLLRGTSAKALIATSDTNQFFYKMNTLEPTTTQTATILVKRQNLGSYTSPITVTKDKFNSPNLILVSSNNGVGIATYQISAGTAAGTTYRQIDTSTKYTFTSTDLNGQTYSDEITLNSVIANSQIAVTATKEAIALAAKSTGDVLSGSIADVSGAVQVNVGADAATPTATAGTPNTFTTAIASSTGVTSPTVNSSTGTYTIGGLTQDTGSVTLAVAYTNGSGVTTTTNKTITYVKTKVAAPTITFTLNNKSQTVNAKSDGTQLTSFSNITYSITETYNGVTTTKSVLKAAPTVTSTLGYTGASATTSQITLANFSTTQDSELLKVEGIYVDAEGSDRTVFDTISLAKVKQAAPLINLDVAPTTQTIQANSRGSGSAAPIPVNITLSEAGAALTTTAQAGPFFTNGLAGSFTGGSLVFTSTADTITADSASFGITVRATNSENNIIYKFVSGSVSKAKAAKPVVSSTVTPQSQTVKQNNNNGVITYDAAGSNVTFTIGDGAGLFTYSGTAISAVNDYTSRNIYSATVSQTGTGTGFSTSGAGNTLTIVPGTPAGATGIVGTITVAYRDSEGTYGTLTARYSVGVSLTGNDGPGLVFRGAWSGTDTYYYTADRRDVVLYNGTYYALTSPSAGYVNATPPPNGTVWTALTQFSAVATDILLAQDATITKSLVMGAGTSAGTIRGGHTGYNVGATPGFFLGYDATAPAGFKFSLGNVTGNKILFDSNTLYIGNGTSGFVVGSTALYNPSTRTTYANADATGVYVGTDGITLGANFRVSNTGALTAASATITGGTLASGFTIGTNAIYKPSTRNLYSNADLDGIYLGTDGITLGDTFRVTSTGDMTASNVNLTGTLNATAGNFTGFVTAGAMRFGANVNSTNSGIYIGANDYWYSTANFSLGGGVMTYIPANGFVSIGGWKIDGDAIYTGTKVTTMPNFANAGSITIHSSGYISSNQFYITTGGSAVFKGTVNGNAIVGQNGSTVTVGGWTVDGDAIYKGTKVGSGVFAAAGAMTIGTSPNAYISANQFYIATDGTAFFKGSLQDRSGTGWISTTDLDNKIWTDAFGAVRSAAISMTGRSAGLYINADATPKRYIGFWSGTAWGSYLDSSGNFYLSGSADPTYGGNKGLIWEPTSNKLIIGGTILAGAGTIGGWTIGANQLTSNNPSQTVLFSDGTISLRNASSVEKVKITYANIVPQVGTSLSNAIYNSATAAAQTNSTTAGNGYSIPSITATSVSSQRNTGNITAPANVTNATFIFNYAGISSIGSWQNATNGTGFVSSNAFFTVRLFSSNGTQLGSTQTVTLLTENRTLPKNSGTVPAGGFSSAVASVTFDVGLTANNVYYLGITLTTTTTILAGWNETTVDYPVVGTIYANTSGWSTPSAVYYVNTLAVSEKLEIGINGLAVGNANNQYAAIGTVANTGGTSGLVGNFLGNVSIAGTLTVGSLQGGSDRRLKLGIQPIQNGILKIQSLKPSSWIWNKGVNIYEKRELGYGFIADEIEEVFPELIMSSSIGVLEDAKTIDYTSLHGITISALQEMITKIENLETKITELENKISGSI